MTRALCVGREAEIAAILTEADAAVQGTRAAVLLVRGAPGSGKTTVLDQAVVSMRERGYSVARGRADALDAARPYAALLDTINRSELLSDAMREALETLRAVVDPVAVRARPGAEAARGSERVLDLTVRALRTAAQEGPQVVVLEDLHHADAAMMQMLATGLRSLDHVPVVFLLSLRHGFEDRTGELESFVNRRAADKRAVVLDLEPLSRADARELVQARVAQAGSGIGPQDIDALAADAYERTGGLPLFLDTYVHQHLEGAANASTYPRRTRMHLQEWLLGYDALALRVAQALSVLTSIRLVDLECVQEAIGYPASDLEGAFDRLVRMGVLYEEGREFHFAQPMLREELYDALGAAQRVRMHARAARHLEARGGRVTDLVGWATHVVKSTEPGDDAGFNAALEVAEHVGLSAPLVAAEWVGLARERLLPGDPREFDVDATRVGLLSYGGRLAEAIALSEEVLEKNGIGGRTARLAREHSMNLLGVGRFADALEVLTRAERSGVVDPAHAPVRAHALYSLGRREEADAAALLAARNEPMERDAYFAWLVMSAFDAQVLAREDRDALRERLEREAGEFGPLLEREARAALMVLAMEGGGGANEARRHARRIAELTGEDWAPRLDSTQMLAQTELSFVEGAWDEALAWADLGRSGEESAGMSVARDAVRALGVLMLDDLARPREAADLSRGLVARAPAGAPLVEAAHARVLVSGGEIASARDRLIRQIDWQLERGLPIFIGLVAEELARLPESDTDDEVLSHIRGAHELAAPLGWPANDVYLNRTLARMYCATDPDTAARHASVSWEIAHAHGMHAESARSGLVLGALGVDASSHLVAAHDLFRTLGAADLVSTARRHMRSAGIPIPRQRRRRGKASEVEGVVARLAIEGLTNHQIAQRLHYSVKTVELYLSRVYQQYGVSGRVALASGVASGAIEL